MSTVQSSAKAWRATAAPDRALKRIVVGSVARNAMEWDDCFVYGMAAARSCSGSLLFPASADRLIGTLGAFGAFARCAPSRMLAHIHTGDRA
jgi:MFS transporter, MHS family, shikimate and dehydroshikimate transport protein